MKRLHFIAALCLSITLLVPGLSLAAKKAQSRNINFGAITCGEFLQDISQSSDEDAGVVLMWIDGYLSGVSGDTTLDWKNSGEIHHRSDGLLRQQVERQSAGRGQSGWHFQITFHPVTRRTVR